MNIINGFRVIISEPQRYEFTTNRSWKDRLFSLPFNPFKSTKVEVTWTNAVKDGEIIKNGDCLVMTDRTYDEAIKALEKSK